MLAADTNVLARLLVQDDAKQVASAKRAIASGGWISTLVLVELIWVLQSRYDYDRETLALVIENLLNHELLHFEDLVLATKALARYRHAPKVSFSDCVILETALKAGHTPLITFDLALAKQPGAKKI